MQCDDGNSKNGDGCSKKCEVETDFICVGGSETSPDVCKDGVAPTFVVSMTTNGSTSNLDTDRIKSRIKFSEAVVFPDECKLNVVIDPKREFAYGES